MKINEIRPKEHDFTNKLANISKPPERIYYLGELPVDTDLPVIGIVGTRKPSSYGREVTYRLAYDLAKRGFIIVSGLATGVDAIAHQATIDAGGITLAVVATPLPQIYPRSNEQLARNIVNNGGAIISESREGREMAMGKFSFLLRNRLVSGLSHGILITEAAAKSGSLNTAAHALSQGCEVFVTPGHITSPLSAGCNNLLKQGACPVTEAQDIIQVLAPHLAPAANQQTALIVGDTPAQSIILKLVSGGQRDGEVLLQESGLSASDFSTALTMLQINGLVRPLGANQWTLK